MAKTLKTVKNYALSIKKSTTAVYDMIKAGTVKCEVIDGIKFIVVK